MNLNLIAIVLLLPLFLAGQNQDNQVEKIIKEYLPPHGPGLAIMAMQNKKVVYENAFGMSDLEAAEKIQTKHLFRIGSITKQFTATAILKLAYEKKIDLDDSINTYFPDVTSSDEITIKHLLKHTSGLGNQSDIPAFSNDDIDLTNYPSNMIQAILSSHLKFAPGTDYAYSNLGYIVLGYLIEKISGMPYEQYLKKTFFEPLDMDNTGFEYMDDAITPKSKGYSMVNGEYAVASSLKVKIAYSAGGMVSTLQDLGKWNSGIMKGEVLPTAYVSQLQKASVLPSGKSTGYSFGWQIGNIQGLKTVKHDGIINGFTSMAIYVPEFDVFVIALSNCDCFRDIELPTSKVAALFINKPFSSQNIKLSINELEKYQGKYSNGKREMTIATHDSVLMYFRPGGEKKVLTPIGKNNFQIEGGVDQMMFSFNDDKSSYALRSLNDIVHWEKIENHKAYKSISLTPLAMEEYVGKYQVPNAFVFEVVRVDDKLYGQIGNDRKEIFCYDTDKFTAYELGALLEFFRDEQAKVVKLTINQGQEIVAEKIE